MSRILFVDDDPTFTESHRENLADVGHCVEYARTLGLADKWLFDENRSYDLLIVDLALPPRGRVEPLWRNDPAMPGWIFGKLVRAARPNIPIIYLTNFPNRLSEIERSFGDHDHGAWKKEYTIDSFRELVASILKSPRRR